MLHTKQPTSSAMIYREKLKLLLYSYKGRFVCMRACVHACVHACMRACACVHACVCVHAYIHACVYEVHTYAQLWHKYTSVSEAVHTFDHSGIR